MEQLSLWVGVQEHVVLPDKPDDYAEFVDKFKPKKTTDDCYTPENIYNAVAQWVANRYELDRSCFVRPFYPGGDYQRFDYSGNAVVVDNPPFSILAQIISFYAKHNIKYFLFAPTLTLFSKAATNYTCLPIGVSVTYENGANVQTSFVTNLEDPEIIVRTYPDLYKIIDRENDLNLKQLHKELPKYVYPAHVLTAAKAYQFSHYGVEYTLKRQDCTKIEAMDAQRAVGKDIFGKGLLLSNRAAAERAAAVQWQLSERELEIIKELGGEGDG